MKKVKWDRRFGSKREQGILTPKAPQNVKHIIPESDYAKPKTLEEMEEFLRGNQENYELRKL